MSPKQRAVAKALPKIAKPTKIRKKPTKPKPLPRPTNKKPLVIDYSVVAHEPDSAASALSERLTKIARLMDQGMTLEEAKYMVSNHLV